MKPAIYLNALGMVTALGDARATLRALRERSTTGLCWRDDLRADPVLVAAVSTELPATTQWPVRFRSRNNQLAAAAYAQIQSEVHACVERYGAHRIGVIIGSSTSGILEGGAAVAAKRNTGRFPDDYDYGQQEIGAVSEFVRELAAVRGPAFTISTACTSGAKALAAAARLIELGVCDAVVAGGADSLCPLTVSGFSSLESVARERSNPFSRNRDGITIGEAAALFLVSRSPAGVRLAGWGESSDAHHMSAPDPQGMGPEIAIREAMQRAGIHPQDVGYINLHGTGTPKNDEMESHVVERIFGLATPASSTKPLIGHTLGAAGAVEAGICWQLLVDGGRLPPHCWDGEADPALPPILLCTDAETPCSPYLLSSSFAFGGSNAVIALGKD